MTAYPPVPRSAIVAYAKRNRIDPDVLVQIAEQDSHIEVKKDE
jgi:hypothetical protein